MKLDKTQEFYSEDSISYDQRWHKKGGRYTYETQLDIFKKLLGNAQGKKILEIGCGTGRFSALLASSGNDVTLLDLSYFMLLEAQKKIAVPWRGVNSSIYHLPFSLSSFDVIVSINVLNHLEDLETAIQEISRLLKPGGKLIINFSNLFSYYIIPGLLVNLSKKSIGREVYSRWITYRKISDILEKSDLKIVQHIGNVHIPKHMDFPIVRDLLMFLDKISRQSSLWKFAPTIFLKCQKV
jgi:ubiquinone/menaquinone biosynthesis C-methylase UbiE